MTISFKTKTGMTNIRHNNRDLSEEEFKSNEHRHINRALSHENITIIKRDIREVYSVILRTNQEIMNLTML